ncbi:inositol monophosphatase family protein [Corynebacterium tapiri]|uniref:Inositol monophosphatase family protein n=1 Tax=Corynebacterium tapiri TaxID=1448266 RepID=A0A5C4U4B0_9CORY|nr:inositol monophosphatase family protein [Corynebacterium tapiri]TNL98381.1 inositol monophosphatase family protein [Corynebacterium tapiri]
MSTSPEQQPTLTEMVDAIAKTYSVAHADDDDQRLAATLVYNAGRLAWRLREQGVETDFKTSISDVVTDADRAAEQFVAAVLSTLRPEDGILGEEGTARESSSGRTWVIDPVDGTYNFTRGSDYWCSALALVKGDPQEPEELVLGAVHRPAMGYTWVGGPNIPSMRDGEKVRIDAAPSLEKTCLATYLHPSFLANDQVREPWNRVASTAATLRMLGAGSVDLAGVADGTSGAWIQHSVPAWDWLPGKALIEGAGGVGRKISAGGVEWCIAGSAEVVDEIATLLTHD